MSDEMERVEAEPCRCVWCSCCNGTGNIRVSYDAIGRMHESFGDDLDELELCDQCHGGVVEVCDRCQLLEEIGRP